jgi:hypothetical protein
MLENAHNFGFILRYPYGYTHIHGFIYEPWHWRFVGIDIATAMYEQGIIVYEEFYGRFLASDVLKAVQEYLSSLSEYEYYDYLGTVEVASATTSPEPHAETDEPDELYIAEPDTPAAPYISETAYSENEITTQTIFGIGLLIFLSVAVITTIACIAIAVIKFRARKPI